MNKLDYILYVYKNEHYLNLKWYKELFSIISTDYDGEFITVKNNIKYLKIDNELIETETLRLESILSITDVIKLPENSFKIQTESIYTSIGLVISNLLFLEYPFKGKIKYINKQFTVKKIEGLIPPLLKSNDITVEDYKKFVNASSFCLNLNKLFSYSSTYKSVTPAPGIEQYKKDLIAKYDKEYGEDWKLDDAIALQFIGELKKYDLNYIKSDPSYGKMLSGKIVNNSRPRMYMAFGVESGFDATGKDSRFVINSLAEGYPKDKDDLKVIFNTARKGSFDRGAETQQAGLMVKDMQRPSNSLLIKDGDCGTNKGLKFFVDDRAINRYKNVYVIIGSKSVYKESIEEFKGTYITIRTTMYCQYRDHFCEVCASEDLKNYKEGISLLILSSAGVVLNTKMKGMHKASKETMNFNILNTIV